MKLPCLGESELLPSASRDDFMAAGHDSRINPLAVENMHSTQSNLDSDPLALARM